MIAVVVRLVVTGGPRIVIWILLVHHSQIRLPGGVLCIFFKKYICCVLGFVEGLIASATCQLR